MKWRKQITQAVDRHSDRIMDLERFYYGIDNPSEQGIDQRLDALENKVSVLMAQMAAMQPAAGGAPERDGAIKTEDALRIVRGGGKGAPQGAETVG